VLSSRDELDRFTEDVFPIHAELYKANNILICSNTIASDLIAGLDKSFRIKQEEDFAILNDKVVAFCCGKAVTIRTDKLNIARRVFACVEDYLERQHCTYEELQRDKSRFYQLF
jgi:hypothetical protein